MGFPRNRDAEDRKRERQRREDEAPRLAHEIPLLRTLRLEISYQRGEAKLPDATHSKLVVVASAPALFVIPCSDRSCRDGGHDVTSSILHALRAGETKFEGKDSCHGSIGAAGNPCTSMVRYVATATYAG